MPMIPWNDRDLRYAFCFLPAAGIMSGAVQAACAALLYAAGVSPVLSAALLCAVPLLVTGGIHMDGFSDTMDALSSHADREKKLKIMDDPHIGAFGVMWMTVYMLVLCAAYYELCAALRARSACMPEVCVLLAVVPAVSRAVTALAIATVPASKKEGMLYAFTAAANKRALAAVSLAWILAAAGAAYIARCGAVLIIAAALLLFVYFRHMAVKNFGGISGDLCGWLIQISELVMLVIIALEI